MNPMTEMPLEQLQVWEKGLQADVSRSNQKIVGLRSFLADEKEKQKAIEQKRDETATHLKEASKRLDDLQAKNESMKAIGAQQDAEENRLKNAIARTKESVPSDMSYPDPEVAFTEIPESDKIPHVDEAPIEWVFSPYRKGETIIVPKEVLENMDVPVFLVGDLHGDEGSLRAILRKVFTTDSRSILVFLGDLFDRGVHAMETVRLFLWTAKTHPGQVLWLRGNHDEALALEETSQKFVSTVEPHEFADWLNEHPECRDEGRALCKIVSMLPTAAVIGEVWASHGGILHEDTCKDFHGLTELTPEMKVDFVWSRMKDTPSKMPNRSHKGAEVGYKQAVEFAKKLKEIEGIEIRHIVCAHQGRFRLPSFRKVLPQGRYFLPMRMLVPR